VVEIILNGMQTNTNALTKIYHMKLTLECWRKT